MLLKSLVLAAVGVLLCALPASAATQVAVRDDYFQPGIVRVYKGNRVVWVNYGGDAHTVTTRRWSVTLSPGERYTRRIWRDWRYLCRFHGDMTGQVVCRNC
jgi:plastocyanin